MIAFTRYAPELPGWPGDMVLRVVVLSDFHACHPFMDAAAIRAICARANALQPDIVLLLGDYASGPRFSRELAPAEWAGALATLSAPLGVHAVLGNHDYDNYSRADVSRGAVPAERALRDAGVAVYINSAVRITFEGRGFWLAGLGSQRAFHHGQSYDEPDLGLEDIAATLGQVTNDEPILLMAHEPDIFPDVPARVALTLSGHTHGGQIKLFGRTPVVPSKFRSRYVYGHIVEDGRHLLVSAGLGYSGLPIRFATKPEIVLLELGGRA
ncbi:metallophosphoesterase [Devosia psychrophila]|uniref:Calcineurin-like phosphoesterase domain-containing protein n=1 Tax=Devosia psychrophila TaxID=728005 RepID=A0A1I1NT90_9HYPH|nr:metallophosphoesterase [Devosia psychrophila]SFC97983.1 hypothetical protein SAMN04488059_11673 [Devosia psychrophila]